MLTSPNQSQSEDDGSRPGRWLRLAGIAMAGHLVLALYLVERVRINADEGWYLYAASQVARGLQLHADLLFFQPPVMPHVYGGMLDHGPGMLLGARWISLFFMVVAVGLLALTATRHAGPRAATVVIVMVGLHPMLVGTGVWAKPYALALLLISGGLYLWSGPDRPARVVAGALLLGLSAGVRLSLLPVPILAIWAARRRGWAALGAVLGLLLAFRPLLGVEPELIWSQLVGVHLPVSADDWGSDRLMLLGRIVVVFCGFIAMGIVCRRARTVIQGPVGRLCVGAIICTGLLHLIPGALHLEHSVVLMPFLGVLAGRCTAHVPNKAWAWSNIVVWTLLGWNAALHRDVFTVDRGESTLEQATRLGQTLRDEVPAGSTLLTLQTTLAVESGLQVPQGFEMGRFGWTMGGLDREHVIFAMGGKMGAVALAEGDFADDPILRLALQRAVQQVGRTQEVERFGQFVEPLLIGLPPAPSEVHAQEPQ